jgi:hypothetical protein
MGARMKQFMILSLAALTGCSSITPMAESSLSVDKEIQVLSRSEVIAAIKECESAGTRPILINAKRKVNNQIVPSIIEVTCLPTYK